MKRLLFYLLAILVVSSCQNKENKKRASEQKENTQSANDIIRTEYLTKSGKKFIIQEDYSMGASICKLEIETRGFTKSNAIQKLGETDPVHHVFVTDLDKNGFDEIYIITSSAGSGSYSKIHGLGSNYDKSATPIYVHEATDKQLQKGGMFEGYMGHNKFMLKNGTIVNTFPIYKPNDTNSNPTGGKREISYSLIAGEAGWILKPEKIIR